MRILIAEHQAERGQIWAGYLHGQGAEVIIVKNSDQALHLLDLESFDILILNLLMPDGGAIIISDFVNVRHPDMPIIAVTTGSFFADISVFDLIPNARTVLQMPLRVDDLAAVVEHYATRKPSANSSPIKGA